MFAPLVLHPELGSGRDGFERFYARFLFACASCHVSEFTRPWPLDTYAHIADWADVVRDHLVDCAMPPPEAGMPLPNEESLEVLTWIRCGTPR